MTAPRRRPWLIPLFLGLFVLCTALAWPWLRQERRAGVDDLPSLGAVPAFVLTASQAAPFESRLLIGKVWIADFIFTQCPGVCPTLSAQMARLQHDIDAPALRFVSFSVDPSNDTPAVLAEYARRYGADPLRWVFLTGERTTLLSLIRDGFRLAVAERGPEEAKDGQGLITHSDRFVLVDASFQIRGYYSVSDAEAMSRLRRDVDRVLAEVPGRG